MRIKIRKAILADAPLIAAYMLMAMEDIVYAFIQENNQSKAFEFLLYFIESIANQYSYQNCWVAESDEGMIVAAANVYNGSDLVALRDPIISYIRENFNADFDPENETQSGEYYIDTLAVDLRYHGNGIGTQMLQYLIDYYAITHHQTIGLLVEDENPKAKKLYSRLGFKEVGTKTLVGKTLTHMQYT